MDLGTSGTRAALVGLDGTVLSSGRAEHCTTSPEEGGAEQHPGDWLGSAQMAIAACLAGHGPEGVDPEARYGVPRILALSLTGQMQDLVLLGEGDEHRTFLTPAVLYSDTRAAEDATAIRDALPRWDELTGNPQGATSCAAMWRRLRRTNEDVLRRADGAVFGPAGFLAWTLTDAAWCDITTASTTGLLDIRERDWSASVCDAAGITAGDLPRLADGPRYGTAVGETGPGAPDLIGLPAGIPIVIAPGDAAATTLGLVGLEPGEGYVYLGSSGWFARVLEAPAPPPPGGAVRRLALPQPVEGEAPVLRIAPLLAAGGAAAWAREAFLDGASPAEADRRLLEREAERGRGPSGLLALPSIHGERYPIEDENLRAAVIGMDADTRGIDMYAAVLEGIAHAVAHALPDDAAVLPVTGGGARSVPWRRILADVTGVPVLCFEGEEAGTAARAEGSLRDGEHDDAKGDPALGRTAGETEATLVGAAIAGADATGTEHDIRPLLERGGGQLTEPDPGAAAAYARDRAAHRHLYDAIAEVERARR